MAQTPALVLVHGAWHGPWCWERVIRELDDLDVRAVALPSTGSDPDSLGDLHDDVDAIRAEVRDIDGPVVICGHSYGGAPVTEAVAGLEEQVTHLVYLAACSLDVGESVTSLGGDEGYPPFWDVHADRGYVDIRDPLRDLYGDVEPELARRSAQRLGHQALTSLTQPVTRAGWHDIANTYVICERDLAFPLPAQRLLAQRADSTRSMESAHSPFFSRPQELAALLRDELDRARRPD
jgi:pimeloyl-ACP methyl ester carboxylesterase